MFLSPFSAHSQLGPQYPHTAGRMASTMPPQAQALTPRAERKVREEDDWDPLFGLLELMYGWLLPCMCIGPYGGATARRRPLNVQRGRGGANEERRMNGASTKSEWLKPLCMVKFSTAPP